MTVTDGKGVVGAVGVAGYCSTTLIASCYGNRNELQLRGLPVASKQIEAPPNKTRPNILLENWRTLDIGEWVRHGSVYVWTDIVIPVSFTE